MTTNSTVDVAAEVRGIAARKRIRQSEIAEALHTSRMAVSRRLNGAVPFTVDEVVILSAAFDVPISEFFGDRFYAPIPPVGVSSTPQ